MKNRFENRRYHSRAIVVCVLLWLVSLAGATAGTLKTPHYNVTTELGPEFTRIVADHMEHIFQEYSRRLSQFDTQTNERFNVRVYATQSGYESAMPRSLTGSSGAFVAHLRLLATYKGDRTREDVLRTLYHEGFHQFMYRCISSKCPLWLNEGLAEYFAEATWNGRGFETGQVPPERLKIIQEAIRHREYLPFSSLFALKQRSWLRTVHMNRSQASLQYCQAWSAVHFLIHGDQGRYFNRLMGYLKSINTGMDSDTAFKKHFGQDMAGFDHAWRNYVMNLRPDAKHQCKRNMRLLLHLAQRAYDTPRDFRSLSHYRNMLLTDRRVEWSVTSAYGETFSSSDSRRAADLFRCPFDPADRDTSYVLMRDKRTGLPTLFCVHHSGVIIKGYYRRGPGGEYKVEVEEQVDSTLPPGLKQSIRAKLR